MKKARKMMCAVLTSVMVFGMTVCAWGAEAAKKESYTFTPDPTAKEALQITAGEELKPVLDKLGAADEIKTLTNCANGGKDKVYQYENFDLYTTQNEKKATIIQSVVLKNDKVATEEGLKLGQLPKDVKKLYPDAVEEYGLYTVTLGNTRIVIDCGYKNDKVVDISYEYCEEK